MIQKKIFEDRVSRKAVSYSSVVSPNPPWQELYSLPDAGGCLSIYYNDGLSSLPVRYVTKPGDNKSDPNLETLTYGLFSTCSPTMRSGIVKRRCSYLFFATSRNQQRVLTGYYHLRWYAAGVFGSSHDFCIAADSARFITKPIPLSAVDQHCGTDVDKWFRSCRLLSTAECRKIVRLIDKQPNATDAYVEEIDRLERFSLRRFGYRYVTWKQTEKFSWDLARKYLEKGQQNKPEITVRNSSPSGLWNCLCCEQSIKNKALLKCCPHCGAFGTLRAL